MKIKEKSGYLLILLVVAGVSFFYRLGAMDFWDTPEARRALIAQNMVESNQFLVPYLSGNPIVTKPPLVYWAMALTGYLAGEVNEVAARFPSALAAAGGVLIIYLIGTLLFSPFAGFMSALALMTTSIYRWMAQYAELDMAMVFFTGVAVYFFFRALVQPEKRTTNSILFFAFLALATMTKGPVGLLSPLIPILLTAIFYPRLGVLRVLNWPIGGAVFLLISLPWVIVMTFGMKGFWETVYSQTLGRFTYSFGHFKPIGYYLDKMDSLFFPWSFLVFAAMIYIIIRLAMAIYNKQPLTSYWAELALKSKVGLTFLLGWFAGLMLLLSVVQSKRYYYAVVMTPAFALLIGYISEKWAISLKRLGNRPRPAIGVFSILLGALLIIISLHTIPPVVEDLSGKHFADTFLILLFTGLLILFWGIILSLPAEGKTKALFSAIALAALAMQLFYSSYIVERLNYQRSPKEFCKKITGLLHHNPERPVLCYGEVNHALDYYTHRHIKPFWQENKMTEFLRLHPDALVETTQQYWPELDRERYQVIYRTDYFDDEEKNLILFELKK